jgi:hypothetical protein
VPNLFLDIRDDLFGIGLVPVPVQVLGRQAQLNDEIVRQVVGRDLSAFFPPQSDEGGLIVAHDDAGIGAAMK